MKNKTSPHEGGEISHAIHASSAATTAQQPLTPRSQAGEPQKVSSNATPSTDPMTSKKNKKNVSIGLYAGGFFGCMILMELALEGANNAFSGLSALPYAVTFFQFGCCFLLPLVLSRGSSLATFPKTPQASLPYIWLSVVVFGSICLASMSVR